MRRTFAPTLVTAAAAIAAVVLALWVTAAPAHAEGDPVLTLTAPAAGLLGEPVTLFVTLHDSEGAPIAGETVSILTPVRFLNKFSRAELGRVVTDESGNGRLVYEPRRSGEITLEARFAPEDGAVVGVALVTQIRGDRQLVTSEIGKDAPAFEPWAIVAVLSIVWLALFSVALRIHAISADTPRPGDGAPSEYFGPREEWA